MILKTPSGKGFRCAVKDHMRAREIIHIMRTCFKRHELRTDIRLSDKPCSNKEFGAEIIGWVDKTDRVKEVELRFKDFTPVNISHELVHAHRYLKYGHADARCHDEDSVEAEAQRRIKKC